MIPSTETGSVAGAVGSRRTRQAGPGGDDAELDTHVGEAVAAHVDRGGHVDHGVLGVLDDVAVRRAVFGPHHVRGGIEPDGFERVADHTDDGIGHGADVESARADARAGERSEDLARGGKDTGRDHVLDQRIDGLEERERCQVVERRRREGRAVVGDEEIVSHGDEVVDRPLEESVHRLVEWDPQGVADLTEDRVEHGVESVEQWVEDAAQRVAQNAATRRGDRDHGHGERRQHRE
ncbi:hypothetical protein [Actinospongicola halichondriae]|uniref:hypothetical protein n=1 Tax=Actinospongicola halichondriae TaxID=3236844 RepID=UPI003D460AD2